MRWLNRLAYRYGKYAIKNIMLPVSDYLDYDTAPITISPGGRDAYTYKGKVYGLTSIPDSHKLFYRKSAFQNLGIEDPRDIFERGEWTWDKFLEVGRELTYDSDGDGATDKYAYWSWNTFQWFTSNSASFISYDETGTPYFSMGEPNALEALQMIRDMDSANGVYKITAPWMVDHAPDTDLISGRIAMNYTNDSYIGDMNNEGFRSQMGDDLGFVPCPLGPSYTGSNRTADQGGTLGECIGAGSDNPELAVLFMLLKTAPRNAEDEKELAEKAAELQLYKYEDQAGIDLANEMAMNSVFNLAGGYNKLQTIVDNIINDSSATPAQAVEANRAAAENQIAKVLSDSE